MKRSRRSTSSPPKPLPKYGKPFTLFSEIKPQATEWLWEGRIPLGDLTLFDGDPGANKSSAALDLAARVSTGREMPDGSTGRLGGVVLLAGEDSLRKTIRPRLDAAGADPFRVAVPNDPLTLPNGLAVLEQMVTQLGAKLVIIDPLNVFLGKNAGNDQSVRQALTPLGRMAERHGVAVVMIRHLTKSGAQKGLYRGLGSIGIVAAARSSFIFGRSPKDHNMGVMAQVKNNLGPLSPSLLYEPVDNGHGVVRIDWRGMCEYTPDEILSATANGQSSRDDAKQLLMEVLADGPVEQKVIEAKAAAAGISLRTLERAKAELEIVSRRKGFGKGSVVLWESSQPSDDHRPPTQALAVYEEGV
jgi:hypothetical protein